MAGIKLDFIANVANFLRGTRDIGDSLSDVSDSLDTLATDARTSGRDIDRALHDVGDGLGESVQDGARDAGRAVDRLETDIRSSMHNVDRSARGAGDGFDALARNARRAGDTGTQQFNRAGHATGEFKDEAKANLSEVASSFQGDMTSAVDLVQGTLGGLVGSLGPVGAAIGAAGAIGVGALIQNLQKRKEEVQNLISTMIDDGGKLGKDSVFSKLQEFAKDGTLQRIRSDASRLGVSFADLASAYAGNADALERVLPKVQSLKTDMQNSASAADNAGQSNNDYASSIFQITSDLEDQKNKNRDAQDAVDGYTLATKKAAAAAEKQQVAEEAKAQALDETKSLVEQQGGALDAYTSALDDNAKAAGKNAEDVTASVDQVNAKLEEQVQAFAGWAGNLKTLARRGVDEGVLAELARLGPEGAPLVAKLATATEPELDKYVTLSKAKAKQGTDGFIASLIDGIPGIADAGARQRAALITAVGGDIPVTVKFKGDAVEFYRTLADVRRAASTGINVQAKFAAADRAIP